MASQLTVCCISLAGSDRRARMKEQLDATPLEWSFFDARIGVPIDLPHDPARAVARHGRRLTSGELGCFASHWALWERLIADDAHDIMLVLEDDLIINPVFFDAMETVAEAARGYGYLRLYAKVPAGLRLETTFLDRNIARFSGRAYGTQAYLITKDIARRWRASIREIVRPIDDEMDRYWAHDIPIRAVFPFPVMEIAYGSTIEAKRRVLEPLSKTERLRWEAAKAWEKLQRHFADLRARLD
jgi:glycosyl transferase family 25